MTNRFIRIVLFCVVSMVLSSCATPYKAYNAASVAPNELAYLVPYTKVTFVSGEVVEVKEIDAKKINTFGNPKFIELLPGTHVIMVRYEKTFNTGQVSHCMFSVRPTSITINMEKGHTYALKPVSIQKDGQNIWEPVVTDITGEKGDPRLERN